MVQPTATTLWRTALSLSLICGVLFGRLNLAASPASKPHVITFGKWIPVQWPAETVAPNAKPLAQKVRPILVDARLKEFTLGAPHDVTDRLFVIRRAFRVNDSLPQESISAPRWQWQPGGWLLVDRLTGRISAVNLPQFDPEVSAASWYRDYAAYCGVSGDGKKIYAMVAQIGRRKPVLKKALEDVKLPDDAAKASSPDSLCPSPTWERFPTRVAFEPADAAKQSFSIRGHIVDVISEPDDEEEEGK